MNIQQLRTWIGRREIVDDELPTFPARALAATLDRPPEPQFGCELPPLWHWIYFLTLHRQSEIDDDGNGKRGEFIPPIPLPRRMFAGSHIVFHGPIKFGRPARRISQIEDIILKRGKTGQLVFLKINVAIESDGEVALTERQDIVYREPDSSAKAPPVLETERNADWTESISPDYAMLFRYSALIFNAHKIHLDRSYATDRQGYGGLVVHGQLVATLLAELARKNMQAPMTSFRFKAIRPILDTSTFSIAGARDKDKVHLWARDGAGLTAMEAEASFLPSGSLGNHHAFS